MDFLGLIIEFLLLGMGVYFYLFALGRLRFKDPEGQQRADAFREKNGWWIRLGSLALIAIMVVNIFLHIQQMLAR